MATKGVYVNISKPQHRIVPARYRSSGLLIYHRIIVSQTDAADADRLLTMEAVPVRIVCCPNMDLICEFETDACIGVAQVCSGRAMLVVHTWQPPKQNFLLSDAKRVARAETPTALTLARFGCGVWLKGRCASVCASFFKFCTYALIPAKIVMFTRDLNSLLADTNTSTPISQKRVSWSFACFWVRPNSGRR